jgi:hypothetical protein
MRVEYACVCVLNEPAWLQISYSVSLMSEHARYVRACV